MIRETHNNSSNNKKIAQAFLRIFIALQAIRCETDASAGTEADWAKQAWHGWAIVLLHLRKHSPRRLV